jgi:hypothetical protein
VYLLLPLTISAVFPLGAEDQGGKAKDTIGVVLYEGPLSHDQNWTLKAGPRGPDNDKLQPFGGTCSMVPADVSNVFAVENIVFTAERQSLGIWKMSWTDTVSGTATDGNRYRYQQRFDFIGPTTDGRMPKPNREVPAAGNDGFLQVVPSNVSSDALDFNDFFLLLTSSGDVAASSHVRAVFRLQIPPVSLDPPPSFAPVVLQGKYIPNIRQQLAGQAGCDPL